MKADSQINEQIKNQALINPIYEQKLLSVFLRIFIRFVDIIGGLVGIIILIPLSIYAFIDNIRNKEKGSLFYTQQRIGKNGNLFNLYKLNAKAPYSEFAQFINVLLGQMTLVGPRPYTTEEIEKMGSYYDIIIKSKPGLTGVYQISGKKTITFEERLDLDLHYLFNSSLKLNIKLLLITLLITLRKDRTEIYERIIYSVKPEERNAVNFSRILTLPIKRIIDIIGSLVGIILLIPLTFTVFMVNLISRENGPVFYSHIRIGKNGKKFKMYKYRSMVVNADEKLKNLLENDDELRIEFQKNRKLKNDPRITKIGKFLRKTSLDEFPQFINVLRGEMSLVGPRAVVDDEIEMFGDSKKTVLSVKPGITGYWAANR